MYYTAGEYKQLLSLLRIVATTNEQVNDHILSYFDKSGIAYENRSLKTGDYSFRLDACSELGISRSTYFTDELFIERKNSLTELSGSLTNEAFHYELKRARLIPRKFLLVEQDGNGWDSLRKGEYRTKYSQKAFWAMLHHLEAEYDLHIKFVPKELMGLEIYSICKATLDSKIMKSSV